MSATYRLTRHTKLDQVYAEHIVPFWQDHVITGKFQSEDGLAIAYAYCLCPDAKATVVISPGRTEGYLKYQEFIYDLYQNGFSAFVIDHRGQGYSERMIANPHKGFVDDFQHYVDDFRLFYRDVVAANANAPLCLLGHSMGAAIGTLYLEQHPNDFVASAMSAPMFSFRHGALPYGVVKTLISGLIGINRLFGRGTAYFYGQKDYESMPFESNQLTSCEPRYKLFRRLYDGEDELHLGGITFRWLAASIKALDELWANIDKIKTPMLVMQVGKDEVVDGEAQGHFADRLIAIGDCEKRLYPDSAHEVFFEVDEYRDQAMTDLLLYFSRLSDC